MLLWGGKEIYQQEFERLKNEFDQVDKNFKIVILLNKGSQVKGLRGTATVSDEPLSYTIEGFTFEKVRVRC